MALPILLMGGVLGGACTQPAGPVSKPIEQAWEAPAPAQQPNGPAAPEPIAVAPASGPAREVDAEPARPAIATVNGRAISRDKLMDILVETHGLPMLEQLILLAAAQQRAAQMGLTVSAADVAAAHEEALKQIAQPIGGDGAPMDRAAAERLLLEFLAAKNLSRAEWELRMQQRATIHKIAAAEAEKMTVTDNMLREEYALVYGERVQIRHIQASSLSAVRRINAELAAGKDFADTAKQLSENQITGANGGLMPPFTQTDGSVPPLIREAAFTMQPGQVSPAVQQENWYHIIKLERRFPASGVKFENADRDALRKRLLDRLTRQRQDALEEELFRSAQIDIRDDVLRKQFREKYRR